MTIEEKLVSELKKNKMSISTAESCTGGLLSAAIVNVPGASEVFREGYVTYADESKMRILHVEEETLHREGAVSEETAALMAKGCACNAKADIGVSTTGIAGPGGGTKEKPVGLVYIGCFFQGKTYVEENIFQGSREEVRRKTVSRAMTFVLEKLSGEI